MLWLYDYESVTKRLTVKVYCMGHISLIQLPWNVAGTGPHGWSAYFGYQNTYTRLHEKIFNALAQLNEEKKSLF